MNEAQLGVLGLSARDLARIGEGTQLMNAGAAALSPESVHVNRSLTNFVAGYPNREYVADQVSPIVGVDFLSDTYFTHPQRQMFQIVDPLLASSVGEPNSIRVEISQTSYGCRTYALQGLLPNQTQANQDPALDSQAIIARKVRNALFLSRERRVAVAASTAANYGTNTLALTAGNRFDDATSDPRVWIDNAKRSIRTPANRMGIGQEAYLSLIRHPKIEAAVNGRPSFSVQGGGTVKSSPIRPNRQTLADLFDLERVVVFEALYDTAVDGAAESLAQVFDRQACALMTVTDTPNIHETATFMYTFRHKGMEGGGAPTSALQPTAPSVMFRTVPNFIAGGYGATIIIGVHADDDLVIGGGATGYLLTGCIN